MVIETHKPMQCPNCSENVKLIQIDDSYGGTECIVDPKPVSSSIAGLTFREHVCGQDSN